MHVLKARLARDREAGFTLIELLMVLVILAVLVAMAFPSYVGFRERAERRTAQANLRAAVPAAETYYADHGAYTGMTLASLKTIDAGIPNDGTEGVFVVSAADDTYCLRSVNAGHTYYKEGPDGAITTTACT